MNYEQELERLNEYQKAVVYDENNACIVKAHVGSGKTTVLINKILYLHYEKHIAYQDMMVLTFTNKAANEIKDRLLTFDSTIPAEQLLMFGTFHSVALNLLKNTLPIELLGYTKEFTVIDPDEELDLVDALIHEHGLKIKYKNRLKKRLEQVMSTDHPERFNEKYQDDLLRLKELLLEEKKTQNKMTFADLLHNAIALTEHMTDYPKWIIIDEVQDSDELQLTFIDKLKQEETNLFAVGDPNQVIYSWRGSDALVFYTLQHKYQATERSLQINYRSSATILEAAGRFKEQGKQLTTSREQGDKIVVKNHYNPFQEAQYLAEKIKHLHDEGVAYQDIAIFYRLQNQSKSLEDTFTRSEIPFEVSMKKTLKDYPVLNWFVKTLRYSVHPQDTSSAMEALMDRSYGEALTRKKATQYVANQELDKSPLLKKMTEFRTHCTTITSVEQFYNYFSLDSYLHPTASTFEPDQESVKSLLSMILKYTTKQQMALLEGLSSFLNSSALYGVNMMKQEISDNKDSVKLMTLHAAKGLEFPYVFLIGMNNGLLPLSTRSMEEAEEERRLLFVGMTRAKDHLELSYYTNPEQARVMTGESRYLQAIPEHLLEREDKIAPETSLQDLRRQVEALKREQKQQQMHVFEEETKIEETEAAPAAVAPVSNEVLVKHAKYGVGKVLKEDDMMITVEFEQYGEKEFMKGFCELDYL